MDDQNGKTSVMDSQTSAIRPENRNVWVLTAYGISGLVLFGVLLYYFSSYVTQ
jgi:hypothetical protein